MRITSQTTSLLDMSGDVSPTCVLVWLFALEPLSFPPEIQLGIRFTPWKTQIISLPVKFPADRSKFQFCTTRTVLPCLCFYFSKSSGRNNAKYAFQYTLKNNTTQYAKKKKKKRKNKVVKFSTKFAVGYPSDS